MCVEQILQNNGVVGHQVKRSAKAFNRAGVVAVVEREQPQFIENGTMCLSLDGIECRGIDLRAEFIVELESPQRRVQFERIWIDAGSLRHRLFHP